MSEEYEDDVIDGEEPINDVDDDIGIDEWGGDEARDDDDEDPYDADPEPFDFEEERDIE